MFGDSLSVHLGPPVPLLASLRSMPPAIDLVAGARGELSRSVKQFASDCAEKGPISPKRFGCCHGQNQARGMIANFINRAFGRVSLRGVARVRHAALTVVTGLKQYTAGHSTSKGMRYSGCQERVGLDWRPGSGRVHLPSVRAGVARPWAGI